MNQNPPFEGHIVDEQDPEGFEDFSMTMVMLKLRLKADGFGFEADVSCAIEDIMPILNEIRAQGIEPGSTPLRWDDSDKMEPQGQYIQPPPQQAAPQQPPNQQQQPRPNGWDQQGNPTYPQQPQGAPPSVPTRFDPDGTPWCPHHGRRMAVSKFGGWYCQAKGGDNGAPTNNRGYCAYQYKGA